jgi:hypothetical protein
MFKQGSADGARDTELISACPQGEPVGPQPPNPAYPVMYTRGYDQEYHPELAHGGCKECRK